jgi:hypothetical protein
MNIYLCHSPVNFEAAKQIADDLELLDHTVLYNTPQFNPGDRLWWDGVLRSIRVCDVFVLLLSLETLRSAYCQSEFQYAAALRKRILLVNLSLTSEDLWRLPTPTRELPILDFTSYDRETVKELYRAIRGLPEPEPMPRNVPEPKVPLGFGQ